MNTGTHDNPFAEPGDDERTVVRPIPGGRSPPRRAAAPAPALAEPAAAGPAFDVPAGGSSPVLAAAAPLLALLARLPNVYSVPDPAGLRERAISELRRFEERLRRQNLPIDQVRTAHYALCASLDDAVQNTPWGSRGAWTDASLVSTFHQEVRSGERFFDLLKRLCQNQGRFLPVIELMYVCMSLGMQGRYRLAPRGPAELDRVREETYLLLTRQRRPAERTLSPHWRGVSAAWRPLRPTLPVWVAALAAAGLVAATAVLSSFSLNGASDRLYAASLTLPPAQMPTIVRTAPPRPVPPPPPPPAPTARAKLLAELDAEVGQDLVSVVGTDAVPIVRINNRGMFRSGSAVIEQPSLPLLARVAVALRDELGKVNVVGYTDNQQIRTVRFPSNFQLSQARAEATAEVIADEIGPARVSAEGRADADPLAPNDTPDGRAQNRRVEIVLLRAGAG